MKYKILKDNELKALEDDFVAFLITNGVHNEEWLEINENEPEEPPFKVVFIPANASNSSIIKHLQFKQ